MKKIMLISAFLLGGLAVFAQTDRALHDALVGLGLNGTIVSLILGVGAILLGHFAIPEKWASIFAMLELLFKWFNEKTNRLSKKQQETKRLVNEKLRSVGVKMRDIVSVIMLLFLFSTANAQRPWNGFFKPVDSIIKTIERSDNWESQNNWMFRPYLSLTGWAVQFGGGKAKINALNSVGLGISYDRLSNINDKAYCDLSVGVSFLTQVELNDVINIKPGLAGTVSVFDKRFGVGIGYLDKHPMLLLNFSYSF